MTGAQDGAAGAETNLALIDHRRSLVTRTDVRTDAVSLPAGQRGLISATGLAVQGLVRFIYSVLIVYLLSQRFLGAINSAISTALLATMLWPTSLGAAASKFVARESGDLEVREALTQYIARFTLLTSAGLGVGAGLLTYILLRPGELVTAIFVALLTVGWSCYTFVRGAQYATGRVLRATVWDGLSFVVAVGGLLLVLVFDLRALLLLPLTAGYLLYAVGGWPRAARGTVDQPLRVEINRFVAWGVIGSVTTGGFLQLTMVLADVIGDDISAAAYAAALTLATPASMLGTVLSLLLLPALSGAVGRGDWDTVRRTTDLATRGLIATLGGVFGVLVVGSGLIVALIWPNLAGALPILQVLLVATFLLTVSAVVSESIRSYSEHGPRVVALIRSLGFVVGLGVAVALISRMGVMGLAVGYLVGMCITGVLPVLYVWHRDRHRWRTLMLRVLAGGGLAAGLVVVRSAYDSSVWFQLAMVAAFMLGWTLLHHRDLLAAARRSVR